MLIQNERFQDAVIIERLVRAVRQGIKVRIMVRPPHTLSPDKLVEGVGGLRILDDVGVKIHKTKDCARTWKIASRAARRGWRRSRGSERGPIDMSQTLRKSLCYHDERSASLDLAA